MRNVEVNIDPSKPTLFVVVFTNSRTYVGQTTFQLDAIGAEHAFFVAMERWILDGTLPNADEPVKSLDLFPPAPERLPDYIDEASQHVIVPPEAFNTIMDRTYFGQPEAQEIDALMQTPTPPPGIETCDAFIRLALGRESTVNEYICALVKGHKDAHKSITGVTFANYG